MMLVSSARFFFFAKYLIYKLCDFIQYAWRSFSLKYMGVVGVHHEILLSDEGIDS